MTPEELRINEACAWMDRSRRDLHSAELLIAGGEYADALFHSQQAAEKAMKAFLTFHQIEFQKTHDLARLSRHCVVIDGSLSSALAPAYGLSRYAWVFRYPGAPYMPEAQEAADGLGSARAVASAIEARLFR
jgi:HEPN domain-containing protein